MADQKVSDLPSLNGADVDAADLLYIIDSSAGSAGSKKITVGQYQLAPVSGGTANGVMYLDGSKVVTTGSDLVFDGTNLGIGTSSPGARLETVAAGSAVYFSGGDSAGARRLQFNATTTTNTGDTQNINALGSTGVLAFSTNSSERARITSGGDLLVGGTSFVGSGRISVQNGSGAGLYCSGSTTSARFDSPTATTETLQIVNTATSGNNIFETFYTESAPPTSRGSISYNRAGGLVAYNTTSDYRAKDIIGPVQNPGATIDALKVYEGRMKGATQSRPMLIAHEAQEHAPYAVSGIKDEVNEDGTPKFQQIDVSSLVPLLLAEIQTLRARVAALESA